jgi:hypothetical protein
MKNISGDVTQKDLIIRMLSALLPGVKIYLFGLSEHFKTS